MFKPFVLAITFFGLTACGITTDAQTEPTAVNNPAAPSMTQTISNANFTNTNVRLKAAIESRGLTLFNTIDHAAGAAKAGLELAPNTLYIFGNPKAGTPLMLASPALGLHLPLKAQVYEVNGQVLIAVSDIRTLALEPTPVVNKIAETLAAIQAEAAGH